MRSFSYHRAQSIDEAAVLLASKQDARVIAGGQTLIPMMKTRLSAPTALVDLGALAAFATIAVDRGMVTIGAGATHAGVAANAVLRTACPALAELAAGIGDPHVRHRGTIGGSIANNDPAADYPAAMLGLAATIVTNRREIAAAEFFTGLFETALADDEIIVAVRFSTPASAAYAKFRNLASRLALVGVFVARDGDDVRVAVTGASGNGVFRSTELEAALSRRFHPSALDDVQLSPEGMIDDGSGSAAYRAALVVEMTRQAIARATADAGFRAPA